MHKIKIFLRFRFINFIYYNFKKNIFKIFQELKKKIYIYLKNKKIKKN